MSQNVTSVTEAIHFGDLSGYAVINFHIVALDLPFYLDFVDVHAIEFYCDLSPTTFVCKTLLL